MIKPNTVSDSDILAHATPTSKRMWLAVQEMEKGGLDEMIRRRSQGPQPLSETDAARWRSQMEGHLAWLKRKIFRDMELNYVWARSYRNG